MRSLVSTAPDRAAPELRELNIYRLIEHCAAYRPAEA